MNIIIKLLGVATAIAYMICILFIWVLAEMQGHTWFSAGEPVAVIRYTEWVLGILSICVLVDYFKTQLDSLHPIRETPIQEMG